MGNRLTKIYTRTGDDGSTGMADGSRISKGDQLIHVIGDLDELNSCLAVLLCHAPAGFSQVLRQIQHTLFNAGAELAMSQPASRQQDTDRTLIAASDISFIEQCLDALNADLPVLKEFILPGGGLAASHCHVVRAVCRRVERSLVALQDRQSVNDCLLSYVNRLSDYFFVLARAISKQQGEPEIYWQSSRLKD